MNELAHVFNVMRPHMPDVELTGPHHTKVEIDLEIQARHHASWKFVASLSKLIGAGAFLYAIFDKGPNPTARSIAAAGAVTSVLADVIADQICSKAVTQAPQALKVTLGPTGDLSPAPAE